MDLRPGPRRGQMTVEGRNVFSFLTEITVDGVALWVVLLICAGVFLGSFMDAIAGGGGIITVPTYLMGLQQLPYLQRAGDQQAVLRHRHRVFHGPLHPAGLCGLGAVRPLRRAGAGWLRVRHLAPAPYSGGGAEVPAAGGAAGGGVHHPADPQVAGRAGAAGSRGCAGSSSGRRPLSSAGTTDITAPAPERS